MVADALGLPCVLKAPDGSFGRGVVRCATREDIQTVGARLLERSDVIVAQGFAPTEYDWRIGVLDGQPLYASRYFMAPGHWQIVARDASGVKVDEGEAETVRVEDAPAEVVAVALRAAAVVGDGQHVGPNRAGQRGEQGQREQAHDVEHRSLLQWGARSRPRS